MCQVCQEGGGCDKDEDEINVSELIKATRVAETTLRECTSDGGRESYSNGSASRDEDSFFSFNHSGESEGHTPAGAVSLTVHFGTEDRSSSSSTAESIVIDPEAGPYGRSAHELRDFFSGQDSSRPRERRTRGET